MQVFINSQSSRETLKSSLAMNYIESRFKNEEKKSVYNHKYKNGIYCRPPTTCRQPHHGKQVK